MLLQQITPSMSKKMMRKGGGASAMSGTGAPPPSVAASCYPSGASSQRLLCSVEKIDVEPASKGKLCMIYE